MSKTYEELQIENRELLRKNTRLEILLGEMSALNQELIQEKVQRISKEALDEQDTIPKTDNTHT